MKIESLGHVVLKVSNLKDSRSFYHGLLGIPISAESEEWGMAFFTLGDHHNFAILEVGTDANNNLEGPVPFNETAIMKWPEDEEPHSDNNLRMYGGKTWFELDDEGHRRFPGDFEAQVSQGPITLHSEETLATSDRGVAYFRKQFKEAVAAVNRGEDPVGTHRAAQGAVKVRCGNFLPDM